MEIAIYDEQTKEFKNIEEASKDPVASKRLGKDVYLMPKNSTNIIPLIVKGYTNIWNGIKWDLIEDNRGTKYWLKTDKWDSEPRIMNDLGEIPADYLLSPIKKSDMTIEEKNEEIKKTRESLFSQYSDKLQQDYFEAFARGDKNAEKIKQEWLASKDKIRAENPYIEKK